MKRIDYEKKQDEFEIIEGAPYAYWADKGIQKAFKQGKPLGCLTTVRNGLKTGDNNEFLRYWWEINFNNAMMDANSAEEAIKSNKKWFPYNKGGDARKWYGNEEYVINWMNGGERVIGVVAVGYGETNGKPHKSKSIDQVSVYEGGEAPSWFSDGVKAALLAPTALNKQAFVITGRNADVSIKCENGIFSGADLGIIKYHFALGAGMDNFRYVNCLNWHRIRCCLYYLS